MSCKTNSIFKDSKMKIIKMKKKSSKRKIKYINKSLKNQKNIKDKDSSNINKIYRQLYNLTNSSIQSEVI